MPCYVFTYHAYGTWMPDREEGFVRRRKGVLPTDPQLAQQYRQDARETVVAFDGRVQQLVIEELQTLDTRIVAAITSPPIRAMHMCC